jgi:succinate dehydrogenase/fumarate reductase flavoprotein subunit
MEIASHSGTEVLIIGGGAAGCRAALAAAATGAAVTLVDKGVVSRSGITITAGGGIQAPFRAGDSEDLFLQDVLSYGYSLADRNLARVLVRDARARVEDLERLGVRFRKDADGDWLQFQMPGQSVPRNVRLAHEGYGLMLGLRKAVLESPVQLLEDFAILELLRSPDGIVTGALGLNLRRNELVTVPAPAVVIATGGYESLWKVTDCPADATGEGLMMAYRAGAALVDLEMVLFYPSVVIWPPAARGSFVHYEWLGEWACDGELRDVEGEPVLPKPLPVRDVAMRLIWRAIEEGRGTERGGLWWDVTNSPKGAEAVDRFLQGQQYRYLRGKLGLDPSTTPIEVAPGAHYQLGGIYIDEDCQTGVPGLFAVPEAAGNLEGANRLSGSALTSTQVFGAIAGQEAALWSQQAGLGVWDDGPVEAALTRFNRFMEAKDSPVQASILKGRLRDAVWRHLGIERTGSGLEALREEIDELRTLLDDVQVPGAGCFNQALLEAIELENMVELADLVAQSAHLRAESRGHHYRADFPARDDSRWLCHTRHRRVRGKDELDTVPVRDLDLSGADVS